jgi:hypothetical protein
MNGRYSKFEGKAPFHAEGYANTGISQDKEVLCRHEVTT